MDKESLNRFLEVTDDNTVTGMGSIHRVPNRTELQMNRGDPFKKMPSVKKATKSILDQKIWTVKAEGYTLTKQKNPVFKPNDYFSEKGDIPKTYTVYDETDIEIPLSTRNKYSTKFFNEVGNSIHNEDYRDDTQNLLLEDIKAKPYHELDELTEYIPPQRKEELSEKLYI